ncbi:MAG: VOC family protein [Methylococcaceae bacterium]|nr:VOC family protein [Methylococcaceae bacterium]
MIGYVTLGTNDIERAAKFYDALLAELGAGRIMDTDRFIAWGGTAPDAAALSIIKPFDGKPASIGNGVMVALYADSPEKVRAIYDKALELGATDEGAPEPHRDGGFYAAYFRDLDGNKLNTFFVG